MLKNSKSKLVIIAVLFLALPSIAAAFTVGDIEKFNISEGYDISQRKEVSTMLVRITDDLLFYVEREWWEKQNSAERSQISQALIDLGVSFNRKIYPELTSAFGNIPEHPVDESGKTTVVFHLMKRDAGGYFRTGDQYSKLEYPFSNERNALYLNANRIKESLLPSYLAHEFIHLITFNQKQSLRNVAEEIWLEELRAEFAPSFLNYDKNYKGSYLEGRVETFLDYPNEPLVRWRNRLADYGVINLFAQYLVDHYGVEILIDSLKSKETGVESINYALLKNNFEEDFSQIFTDWAIALLVNDCQLGEKYCYLNPHLKDLKIPPQFYYLPSEGEPLLRMSETIFNWSANWNKIIGGKEDLILKVEGEEEIVVPYLLCDYQEKCQVDFLELIQGEGEITFFNFGEKYSSLIIIPLAQPEQNPDEARTFNIVWSVEVKESEKKDDSEIKEQLLAQIAELQAEISRLRAKLAALMGETQPIICDRFENNLYFGIRDSGEVRCLQEFLASPPAGGADIYPEAQVTGNFLSLTQAAVIRFQEKYAEEILSPLNLQRGTGYVGEMTRAKINDLINF